MELIGLKNSRRNIRQVVSFFIYKIIVMKVVQVKRLVCSVLAVKVVVYSTLIVFIFFTNTSDYFLSFLLSSCFQAWSLTSSLLSSSFTTCLSTHSLLLTVSKGGKVPVLNFLNLYFDKFRTVMRLAQVSYLVIYGPNMTKNLKGNISQVVSCLRYENIVMKVVQVKRQVCSVFYILNFNKFRTVQKTKKICYMIERLKMSEA